MTNHKSLMKGVKWMVLSAVLFILLSPGVLLTVTYDKLTPLVTVGSPSNATVIHAIVFAIVLFIVGKGLKASGLMGRYHETGTSSSSATSSVSSSARRS